MSTEPAQLPSVPPPSPNGGAATPSGGFRTLLGDVRRRQQRELWLQGALYGVGTAAVMILVAGLVASRWPGVGRALFILAPIAAAAVACFFGIFRALVVVGDEVRTARLVGERLPNVSFDVLAAVELDRELERDPHFSTDLAKAYLQRTDDRARAIAAASVVDPRPTRIAAIGAGAALLVALILFAVFRPTWRAGAVRAFASEGAAPVAQTREPITGEIEVTYNYPAYTGLAAKTVTGTNGEVSAPVGTEVRLRTRSDREVAQANIQVNGKPLPLTVSGGRELAGGFVVEEAGSYAFTFQNARGKEIARGPDLPIVAVADAAPEVTILTPGEETEIDPGEKVTVKFEASDDYGLTGLSLVYRLPAKAGEQRIPLRFDEGRRTRGTYSWALSGVAVNPGDRIAYYIEGVDNDAVKGKKKGVSRTHVLKIYSAAEHRRAAMKKAEALWERLVLHLADRLEGPEGASPKDPEKVLSAAAVDKSGNALVSDLMGMAREISRQRDAPKELWTALANIASTLGPKVEGTADARRTFLRYHRLGGSAAKVGQNLTRAAEEEIVEVEKDILYLEALLDRQKLQEMKELGEELSRRRRELVGLVEEFKKTKDPELQQAILQQVQDLKGRLNELMKRMQELAKGIRDEHLNAEALQQLMEEKDMSSSLDEIEKLIQEGKADEALAKLQQLEREMSQMMDGLQDADQNFGNQQFPELGEKFGKFMEELQKTAADQKRVADQTKEIRERYKQQMKEQLKKKAAALKKDLKEAVDRVQKEYAQTPPDQLNWRAEKPHEQVTEELQSVEQALELDDFALAAESASRAQQAADEMAMVADQQKNMDEAFNNPPQRREKSRKLAKEMAGAANQVRDINKKLQQAMPQPDKMLSEEDRQQMRKLANEQRQLEGKARELGEQMEEMEQMAPLFGQEGMGQMREVGERMAEAGQRLDNRDANRAFGEQQAALDQLEQFQQQMKQNQRRGGQGMPLPMMAGRGQESWGGTPPEKVEVPDPDEYQAPKEFRKDLLDAMKQGAPDKYRDQVKRYYEELVR